jgi:hypothetical protein
LAIPARDISKCGDDKIEKIIKGGFWVNEV